MLFLSKLKLVRTSMTRFYRSKMHDGSEAEFLLRLILTTHGAIVVPAGDVNMSNDEVWNKRIAVTYDEDPAQFTIYFEENTND